MRKISESRKTKETDINLSLNLDGSGISNLKANLPFLEHMLDQATRYSSIDLDLDFDLYFNLESDLNLELDSDLDFYLRFELRFRFMPQILIQI